jgi:hypothetical protein
VGRGYRMGGTRPCGCFQGRGTMPHCSAPRPRRCAPCGATASLSTGRDNALALRCTRVGRWHSPLHRCSRPIRSMYGVYTHDWPPARLDCTLCPPRCARASSPASRPHTLALCRASTTAAQGYYYEPLLWVRVTRLPSRIPRRSRDSCVGGSVSTTSRSANGIGGRTTITRASQFRAYTKSRV